jgi:hypothetical protein
MVGKAIAALKERGGSSRQAILKDIMANFNVGKDAKTVNVHLTWPLVLPLSSQQLVSSQRLVSLQQSFLVSCSEMVGKAIAALKERGGSSRQAILKYNMANFNVGKDAKTVNVHLKLSLRAGVKNKRLKQSKGTGASGSFQRRILFVERFDYNARYI